MGTSETDRVAQAVAGNGAGVDQAQLVWRMGEITHVYLAEGKVDLTLGGASGAEHIPRVPHFSNYRPAVGDPVWVLVVGPDLIVLDRTSLQGPSVIGGVSSDMIFPTETRTATTFGDLLTVGPTCIADVSPSGRLLVCVGGVMWNDNAGGGAVMSVDITRIDGGSPSYTGGTPTINRACIVNRNGANRQIATTRTTLYTGIPPGTYQVRAKYQCLSPGTARFQYRDLMTIPL